MTEGDDADVDIDQPIAGKKWEKAQRSSDKEHKVNALALSADERRDKLR